MVRPTPKAAVLRGQGKEAPGRPGLLSTKLSGCPSASHILSTSPASHGCFKDNMEEGGMMDGTLKPFEEGQDKKGLND